MMPVSCNADWNIAISPFRLSSFVLAISSRAPSAFPSSLASASHSMAPSAVVAFRPCRRSFKASTCCFPPMAARAAFRCSCVIPASFVFSSVSVPLRPLKLPAESNADRPSFSIMVPACPAPDVKLTMIAFRAFPASLPLIPRFAITPSAVALSVIGTPKFFMVPPTPM